MPERLLAFIRPPADADPRKVMRWRWNVALTLLAGWLFIAYSLSPMGFARAEEVESKIRTAVEPIQQQIEEVDKKIEAVTRELADQKRLLLRKLASDLEREIVDAKIRQCKASSVEAAAYFRQQAIDKQAAYFELIGRNFVAPSCAET